jgi:hypothetical protein
MSGRIEKASARAGLSRVVGGRSDDRPRETPLPTAYPSQSGEGLRIRSELVASGIRPGGGSGRIPAGEPTPYTPVDAPTCTLDAAGRREAARILQGRSAPEHRDRA